jgi:hypothetical protein
MPLPGFVVSTFAFEGVQKSVYRRGEGPGVVVVPEIPGITPQVAAFAERVAAAGFTVFVASLFGTPGKPKTVPNTVQEVARACVSREFSVLAADAAPSSTGCGPCADRSTPSSAALAWGPSACA